MGNRRQCLQTQRPLVKQQGHLSACKRPHVGMEETFICHSSSIICTAAQAAPNFQDHRQKPILWKQQKFSSSRRQGVPPEPLFKVRAQHWNTWDRAKVQLGTCLKRQSAHPELNRRLSAREYCFQPGTRWILLCLKINRTVSQDIDALPPPPPWQASAASNWA